MIACLKEVGRLDLVINLTEFIFRNLLEFLPCGFRGPNQVYAMKIHILKIKQRRYVESMQGLQIAVSSMDFWEEWCSSAFQSIVSCATSTACMSEDIDFPQILKVQRIFPWHGWMLQPVFKKVQARMKLKENYRTFKDIKRICMHFLTLGEMD